MIKETIVDNSSTNQLEVFFTEDNTIRLYISDSENPDDYYTSQYIDLDINDTEFLISKLSELKESYLNLES